MQKRSDVDTDEAIQALFASLKAALPALRALRDDPVVRWAGEDGVYRFYHQSFKVFGLQRATQTIVDALRALLPERELNAWFLTIIAAGTGKSFTGTTNERWLDETRPIVEAFFHARYFLDMAVKYGEELDSPPLSMPSGWAAFLYLFNLR